MTDFPDDYSSCPIYEVDSNGPIPTSLLALFEANYECLLALFPKLRTGCLKVGLYRAEASSDMPVLELTILECTRYTTSCILHCHTKAKGYLPQVQIRLYGDTRQAELLGFDGYLEFMGKAPQGTQRELWVRRRTEGNRRLYHWLRYCLRRGYYFPEQDARAP